MASNERLHILEMLDQGQINTEQALTLIQALESGEAEALTPETSFARSPSPEGRGEEPVEPVSGPATDAPPPPAAVPPVEEPEVPPVEEPKIFTPAPEDAPVRPSAVYETFTPVTSHRFRSFWLIPLWVGAAITVVGGLLMFLAWQGSRFGFWFACSWFPFALGVLVLILAWAARGTPWLHLRVRQAEGKEGPRNIVLSFPLPLRLAGWGLRTFGHRIPGLEQTNVDEIIVALEHISPETPFSIEVDEGDGEHVEIYIG
jgi:hypothetical protein